MKSLRTRLPLLSVLTALVVGSLGIVADAQTLPKPPYYRWEDAQGRVNFSDRPPPSYARNVEQVRYQENEVEAVMPYATQKAAADFPVTLYLSETCGPACEQAVQLLNQRRIPFVERQVNGEDQQMVSTYLTTFDAPVLVPSITIGRVIKLKGFDAAGWNRSLSDAGYPN